ncbi:MAG: TIGR03000 domain-containing protein [Pirellulales bacterium]|nr:TIGR03000 domain-containing protein [Pirellulales bacterium]
MYRRNARFLLIGAVVAATVVAGVSEASAFWGWCGPASWSCSPCYTVCYTPCYTPACTVSCCDPCCDPCGGWYVGYRPGPIRRLVLGPYRWYYAGSCTWSSCYCGSCCYDSCCTATETTEPAQAEPTIPTPAKEPEPSGATPVTPPDMPADLPTEPATMPAEPPITLPGDLPGTLPGDLPPAMPSDLPGTLPPELPNTLPGLNPETPTTPTPSVEPGTSGIPTRENSGLLTIYVPNDAKVTVNGLLTQSRGSRRQYVSYGLKPGFNYKYEVQAEVIRDGRPVVESRTVMLTAGDRQVVAFGFNPNLVEGLAAR